MGWRMISVVKNWVNPSTKRKIKWSARTFLQSSIYFFVRGRSEIGDALHIVFVCKGNVCRSPFAEYYLKSLPLNANIKIESCGLDVDQSVPSPSEASSTAVEFGVDLTENRSRSLVACDLEQADLIVGMEYDHFKRLVEKFPNKKQQIVLLQDFAPWPESLVCNIHDPYGCGLSEFRACFNTIKCALNRLALQLAQDHKQQ